MIKRTKRSSFQIEIKLDDAIRSKGIIHLDRQACWRRRSGQVGHHFVENDDESTWIDAMKDFYWSIETHPLSCIAIG